MTSNKCAELGHSNIEMWWNDTTDAPEWACETCGQRLVPSDVLEECRQALQSALPILRGHNWANRGNNPATQARDVLARIDAVLGKKG